MISSSKTNLKIFFSGFFSREQFLNIKFLAKIIGGSLLITILFGGFDYFFDTTRFLEAVHAQSGSTPPPETSTAQTIAEILDVVLKFVYMLMWPLLAIAGKSMDNSLIYGSIFHLDVSLRQIRNVTKNFANFTLGFIVLYNVIKGYFSFNSFSPTDILKKTLIAGVLIQLSWFLVGAVIDLATIATFSIGGLPLVVANQTPVGNEPIISPVVYSNFSASKKDKSGQEDTVIYYRYSNINILPCLVTGNKLVGGEETIKQLSGIYQGRLPAGQEFSKTICIMSWTPLWMGDPGEMNTGNYNKRKQKGNEELKILRDTKGGLTMGSLLEDSKSYVGPFFTLYTSILNMGSINVASSNGDAVHYSIDFLIKAIVGLGLILPLFVLAIGMLVRIGVLWLVIAFSPFLIIKRVFGRKILGNREEDSSPDSIISLIFLPVYAAFAISIALIFLSTIQTATNTTLLGNIDSENGSPIEQTLGIKKTTGGPRENCYIEKTIKSEICMETNDSRTGLDIYFDFLSRIVVNLFAMGLMRTVVFAVLKSSKVTAGLADSISSLGKGIIEKSPIIPVGGGLSLSGLQELPSRAQNTITEKLNTTDRKATDDFLKNLGLKEDEESASKTAPSQVEKAYTDKASEIIRGNESNLVNHITNTTNNLATNGGRGSLTSTPTDITGILTNLEEILTKAGGNEAEKNSALKGIISLIDKFKSAKTSDTEKERIRRTFRDFFTNENNSLSNKKLAFEAIDDATLKTQISGDLEGKNIREGNTNYEIVTINNKLETKEVFGTGVVLNRETIDATQTAVNNKSITEKNAITQSTIEGITDQNIKTEYIKALISPSQKSGAIEKKLEATDIERINSTNINRISPAQIRDLPINLLNTLLNKENLLAALSPAQILAIPRNYNTLTQGQKNSLGDKQRLFDNQTDKL